MAGVWVYLRGTKATTVTGKYGMVAFALILIAVNAFNIFGPAPGNVASLAFMPLESYFGFAAVAFWLDRKRISPQNELAA